MFGGHRISDFEDSPSFLNHNFVFFVNNLSTREEVLTWYLQINSGGVVHTKEEIDKVKCLLEQERHAKKKA